MTNNSASSRPEQTATVREMLKFVARNRWLVLGVPIATLVLAAFFIAAATPVYQGVTSVRVDKERSNIAVIDALQELSQGASIYTEMAELRSRSLAEDVVDTLALNLQLTEPRRVPRSQVRPQPYLVALRALLRPQRAGIFLHAATAGWRTLQADERTGWRARGGGR